MNLAEEVAQLRDRWARLGFDAAAVAPGLDVSTIRSMSQTRGMAFPPEVTAWWTWQNGPADPAGDGQIGPGLFLLSLDQAFAHYDMQLQVAQHTQAATPDWILWSQDWLPVARGWSHVVACDVGPHQGAGSVVRSIEPARMTHEEWNAPRAASLAEMVSLWIEAIDRGVWTFEDGSWGLGPTPKTPEMLASDLV